MVAICLFASIKRVSCRSQLNAKWISPIALRLLTISTHAGLKPVYKNTTVNSPITCIAPELGEAFYLCETVGNIGYAVLSRLLLSTKTGGKHR
jgi:hypothetical protein